MTTSGERDIQQHPRTLYGCQLGRGSEEVVLAVGWLHDGEKCHRATTASKRGARSLLSQSQREQGSATRPYSAIPWVNYDRQSRRRDKFGLFKRKNPSSPKTDESETSGV
jgi:hypothetical protein